MGLIYLVLSLLSFTSIGVLIKLGERYRCSASGINLGLYSFGAIIFILLFLMSKQEMVFDINVIGLGVLSGVTSYYGIYYTCVAARYGTVGRTMGISYMAIGIPVLVGWAIWHESPPVQKLIGIVLIIISIYVISSDKDRNLKSREENEYVGKAGSLGPTC